MIFVSPKAACHVFFQRLLKNLLCRARRPILSFPTAVPRYPSYPPPAPRPGHPGRAMTTVTTARTAGNAQVIGRGRDRCTIRTVRVRRLPRFMANSPFRRRRRRRRRCSGASLAVRAARQGGGGGCHLAILAYSWVAKKTGVLPSCPGQLLDIKYYCPKP